MNQAFRLFRRLGQGSDLACPNSNNCEMFALLKSAGTLRTWQIRYCDGDYAKCARFRSLKGGQPPAPNLMPNGQLLRFSGRRQKV